MRCKAKGARTDQVLALTARFAVLIKLLTWLGRAEVVAGTLISGVLPVTLRQ